MTPEQTCETTSGSDRVLVADQATGGLVDAAAVDRGRGISLRGGRQGSRLLLDLAGGRAGALAGGSAAATARPLRSRLRSRLRSAAGGSSSSPNRLSSNSTTGRRYSLWHFGWQVGSQQATGPQAWHRPSRSRRLGRKDRRPSRSSGPCGSASRRSQAGSQQAFAQGLGQQAGFGAAALGGAAGRSIAGHALALEQVPHVREQVADRGGHGSSAGSRASRSRPFRSSAASRARLLAAGRFGTTSLGDRARSRQPWRTHCTRRSHRSSARACDPGVQSRTPGCTRLRSPGALQKSSCFSLSNHSFTVNWGWRMWVATRSSYGVLRQGRRANPWPDFLPDPVA